MWWSQWCFSNIFIYFENAVKPIGLTTWFLECCKTNGFSNRFSNMLLKPLGWQYFQNNVAETNGFTTCPKQMLLNTLALATFVRTRCKHQWFCNTSEHYVAKDNDFTTFPNIMLLLPSVWTTLVFSNTSIQMFYQILGCGFKPHPNIGNLVRAHARAQLVK